MNEEKFGKHKPENVNESTESQEIDAEDEQADKSENKNEVERGESDFEKDCLELEREGQSIKFDSETTFFLQWVHKEGLQTLINEYGSDEVFELVKKREEAKKPIHSTYKLICALEPDRKKRQLLFDKMEVDAQETGAEIDQYIEEHGLHGDKRYHNGKVFVSNVTEWEVPVLRSIDKVFGGLGREPIMSRLELLVGNISRTYKDKDKEFMNQLAEVEDNIFSLVQLRDKKTYQETNELEHKGNELYQEIIEEIDNIIERLTMEFKEWEASLLEDLSKIGSLDTESEEVKAVLETAIKQVESQITEATEKLEQDITEKTKSLKDLAKRAGSVHRLY
jgi:hypothetical protein